MILLTFISYIAVTFIVTAFLDGDRGIVNQILVAMGEKKISFYLKAEYWPLILTMVKTWKDIGYGSVLYLSVLMGIDQEIKNSGLLYSTTQVWDSYVLDAMSDGTNYGMTAAATFFQSVVGFIMVVAPI